MGPVIRRLATTLLLGAGLAAQAADPPSASQVKAAYLAKFPFYVEWPPAALPAPGAALQLCVVGDDPFGVALDEAVAAQPVQGRPMQVRRLRTLQRDSGCHVAYVPPDLRTEPLRGTAVLLVSEGPNGGGIINFVLRDQRVRFTVDDEAAFQNGLTISSKLLSVALAVKPRGTR